MSDIAYIKTEFLTKIFPVEHLENASPNSRVNSIHAVNASTLGLILQPLGGFPPRGTCHYNSASAMIWRCQMLLEFYRAGQTAPSNFDMFLHADGSTSYSRNPQKTKLVVRVVVELEGKTTTILQKRAMFGLINKNKTCTVAFYEV